MYLAYAGRLLQWSSSAPMTGFSPFGSGAVPLLLRSLRHIVGRYSQAGLPAVLAYPRAYRLLHPGHVM